MEGAGGRGIYLVRTEQVPCRDSKRYRGFPMDSADLQGRDARAFVEEKS